MPKMKPLKTLVAMAAVMFVVAISAHGGPVPQRINYQGTLNTKTGGPANGNYNMTFRIYSTATGTSPLWTEAWSNSNNSPVVVTEGVFNVMLGSLTPLSNEFFAMNPRTYLGISVENDSEFLPRQMIASVGYAFAAGNGIPRGGIIMWSGTTVPEGWALCNGTNGTPDLRDRFIVGIGNSYSLGAVGGTATNNHTHSMQAHTHTVTIGAAGPNNSNNGYVTVDWKSVSDGSKSALGDHYHYSYVGGPSVSNTGSASASENRPPYYALAFIMKL